MNLVVGSCFRSVAPAQVDRYTSQITALQDLARARGDVLHVISVWGDSDDDTPGRVAAALGPLRLASFQLFERSHGFPNYGSSTHPDRIRGFAYAANGVFEAVGAGADAVIYVESDLIWTAETIYRLLDQLTQGVDVIAPMTMAREALYDTWGTRTIDGRCFGPFPPYYTAMNPTTLTEVGSVGSCVVMRSVVARACRSTPAMAIVGLCEQARERGYHVYLDPRERIDHP